MAVVGICTVLTLLPELGSTKLGTGGMAAEASDRLVALSPSRSLTPGPPDYWTREFRRRWKLERADGKARARTIRRLRQQLERDPTVGAAICAVFGPYCGEARRVAWCESRYYTGATNGQYRGLYQMGSYARSRFGHGATALMQSWAAYRYFVASGRDWSPWECRP